MFPANLFSLSLWAAIIQMFAALAITGYVITAAISLIPKQNVDRARVLVAEGVLTSLSFMVAATLLRMLELQTWRQILIFSLIFLLRTVLKKVFVWEKKLVLMMTFHV
ncbi:MAG: DUF1622 domain-containing protein [Coleofasciculus sp. S288]|nr:DUF1622 domain-containing protein [Coleofasciculus sp. S288]